MLFGGLFIAFLSDIFFLRENNIHIEWTKTDGVEWKRHDFKTIVNEFCWTVVFHAVVTHFWWDTSVHGDTKQTYMYDVPQHQYTYWCIMLGP